MLAWLGARSTALADMAMDSDCVIVLSSDTESEPQSIADTSDSTETKRRLFTLSDNATVTVDLTKSDESDSEAESSYRNYYGHIYHI